MDSVAAAGERRADLHRIRVNGAPDPGAPAHAGHARRVPARRRPGRQRQEIVDRFQSGDGVALILSVRAAGTGLNLTGGEAT